MRQKSIFNQVLLLMIGVIILPMILVYGFLSSKLVSNLHQNHKTEVQRSAYNAAQSFKGAFSSVIDVSVSIIGNVYIHEFLVSAYMNDDIYTHLNSAKTALEKYYTENNYISHIQVSTIDGEYMISTGIAQPLPFTDREVERMLASSGTWFCERSESGALVVYRLMNNTENLKQKLGFIKLIVDETMLSRQIRENSTSMNPTYLVLNEGNDTVLLSTNESNTEQIIEMLQHRNSFERIENAEIASIQEHYLVSSMLKVNTRRLSFITVVGDRSMYYSFMKYGIMLLILVLFTLFAGLSAIYYRKQIVIPLERLGEQMRHLRPDGGMQEKEIIEAQGEVGDLVENFNAMAVRLNYLYETNYKNELKLRDANLLVLQSEINPHFLHNILNSIQWMIELDEKETASNMVRKLSEMFRLSLTIAEKSEITLQQELEHLDKYITLEKYRLEEKVHFYINIQDGLKDAKVGKFILQPLIENALVHGIAKCRGYGNVLLSIYSKEEELIYDIRDDGAGADPEKIQRILDGNLEKKNSLEGFALENIQTRLKLRCGDHYGITYKKREEGGSVFLVRQPLIFQMTEEVRNETDDCGR